MSLSRVVRSLVLVSLLLSSFAASPASFDPQSLRAPDWVVTDAAGEAQVPLYVFWSKTCPHCAAALRFLETLREEYPWIQVRDYELAADRAHVMRYVEMARALGEEARSVPAFFVCGRMLTGFDDSNGVGAQLVGLARFCRQVASHEVASGGDASAPFAAEPPVRLPLLGAVEPDALSLPVFTLVLAGLDAFNPCAFFVLFFLLSLMVHARSRARMILIGGTFVLFSGLVYFLFMAAWLNLFLVVGGAAVVTTVAGLVALLVGGLNVKDYFFFGQGPTLSIPAQAKPGLFARMRALLSADRMGAMLVGTLVLALAANSYELLCTAGFPMVYTRVLTLNDLSAPAYYAYLGLYNVIYVLPLLTIVLVFTFTLGAKKLSKRQGRILKLLSGLMMLSLGLVMLLAPELLTRPWVGALLLVIALSVTALIAAFGPISTADRARS
jgi:glutaredoxin